MSKRPKEPLPANLAGMEERPRVRHESFANLARFPGIRPHVKRHINHHRCADDVFPRHTAPEAAVIGIRPVVAHREVTIVRNLVRIFDVGVTGWRTAWWRRLARSNRVTLDLLL